MKYLIIFLCIVSFEGPILNLCIHRGFRRGYFQFDVSKPENPAETLNFPKV